MPGPFERHARSKEDGWGPYPSRSALAREAARDDPDPSKHAPARKATRRWCKGREGVEHIPLLEARAAPFTVGSCRWGMSWHREDRAMVPGWRCIHAEVCVACRKVLTRSWDLGPGGCPAYPGDPAQKAAVVAEIAELAARPPRFPPKPPVTGPQHYRRLR